MKIDDLYRVKDVEKPRKITFLAEVWSVFPDGEGGCVVIMAVSGVAYSLGRSVIQLLKFVTS